MDMVRDKRFDVRGGDVRLTCKIVGKGRREVRKSRGEFDNGAHRSCDLYFNYCS